MTDGPERPGTGPERASPGDREPGETGRADGDEIGVTEEDEAAQDNATCELCGSPVVERHCKIVCLNCGYTRDCSDP